MLFRPKRPVDSEEWEWLLAGMKWLEREFPDLSASRILAVPDRTCFPPSASKGPARGEDLFEQVQRIAGMAAWPVRLVPIEPLKRGPVNSVAALQSEKGACGSFRLSRSADGTAMAEIRYSLDQLEDPAGLVATFAHELAHYLLHSRQNPIPGGDPVEELFTDLTAVWLGFGIFLGNSARYAGHVDEGGGRGWFVSGRQGYLSERMLMTGLVLSERVADRDPAAASPYLKKYLADDLKMAQRYSSTRDLRGEMAAIDLADYGV